MHMQGSREAETPVKTSMNVHFRIMALLLGVKIPWDPITAHVPQYLFCFLIGNYTMNSFPVQAMHLNATLAVF